MPSLFTHFLYSNKPLMSDRIIHLLWLEVLNSFVLSIHSWAATYALSTGFFVLWSVSPVAKLAILFQRYSYIPVHSTNLLGGRFPVFRFISFLLGCLWQLGWTMNILYHFWSIVDNTLRHACKEYPDQLTSNGYHCLSAF